MSSKVKEGTSGQLSISRSSLLQIVCGLSCYYCVSWRGLQATSLLSFVETHSSTSISASSFFSHHSHQNRPHAHALAICHGSQCRVCVRSNVKGRTIAPNEWLVIGKFYALQDESKYDVVYRIQRGRKQTGCSRCTQNRSEAPPTTTTDAQQQQQTQTTNAIVYQQHTTEYHSKKQQ